MNKGYKSPNTPIPYPARHHNKVVGGILVSLRPSVRPSVHPSYQATSEGVSHVKFLAKFQNLKFWQFFKICSFDFVLFWLGILCESPVWVIMGQRGVSQNAGAGILGVLVPSRNVHISDLNGVLGDMEQTHCRICEIVLCVYWGTARPFVHSLKIKTLSRQDLLKNKREILAMLIFFAIQF